VWQTSDGGKARCECIKWCRDGLKLGGASDLLLMLGVYHRWRECVRLRRCDNGEKNEQLSLHDALRCVV